MYPSRCSVTCNNTLLLCSLHLHAHHLAAATSFSTISSHSCHRVSIVQIYLPPLLLIWLIMFIILLFSNLKLSTAWSSLMSPLSSHWHFYRMYPHIKCLPYSWANSMTSLSFLLEKERIRRRCNKCLPMAILNHHWPFMLSHDMRH